MKSFTRRLAIDGRRTAAVHRARRSVAVSMARPEGIEPPAYRFEACRSIQLSYGRARQARAVRKAKSYHRMKLDRSGSISPLIRRNLRSNLPTPRSFHGPKLGPIF